MVTGMRNRGLRAAAADGGTRVIGPGGIAYWLSAGLAVAAAASSLLTFLLLAAGYLAGLALVAWISIQLLVLQRYFFLQPAIACLGAAEVILARTWQLTSTRTRR